MAPKKFVKGQSGNPLGRPQGARNKFSEDAVAALATDWAKHGAAVLAKVRTKDPSTYLRVAFGVIPRDVAITFEQRLPGNLSPDEFAAFRRLGEIIKAIVPAGSDPAEVFEAIEHALRSKYAKLIEHS